MTKEIWLPINSFENKYEISNYGRIKNIRTGNIFKTTNKTGDYFRIILYDETHKKSCYIHRLVAEHFISNPNNLPQVNHKDLNKQNNFFENLEWCSVRENINHSVSNNPKCMEGAKKYNKNKFKQKYGRLFQYDKQMNLINIYENPTEASLKTGVCKRNILQVINHQQGRTQAGGYVWKSEKEVMSNEI